MNLETIKITWFNTTETDHINNLPDEILHYIFSYLNPKENTWLNVILTNKRFFSVGRKVFDPSLGGNLAIQLASAQGNLRFLEELLLDSRVNPGDCKNLALRLACENGHIDIVRVLLKDHRTDPSDCSNEAIQQASANGHIDIVEMLLNDYRVDPTANNNLAIRNAAENGHNEVVNTLINDTRVLKASLRRDWRVDWET